MARCPAEILARHARRQRHHALSVDPVVFTNDGGIVDARHVAEKRLGGAAGRHRHHPQVLERRHSGLWDLHLHLERDAGSRVCPVVWRHEPARRGCGSEGSADLVHCEPELSCHSTIDVDLNGRVVERLPVLEIPQRRDRCEFLTEPGRECPACGEVRPHHRNFHWSGRAEVHDATDDVAWLERELRVWKRMSELGAQTFLETGEIDRGVASERDLQYAFVGSSCPQEDGVDGVRRWLHADVAERDVYVLRSCRVTDDIEHVATELLRCFELGAGRRAESKLEGLAAARRKDLTPERRPDRPDDAYTDDEVYGDDREANRRESL